MNTKGIKFLAVLAVMVMAFAAVIVLAPADNDVVAENVYAYKDAQKDPTVITADLTDSTKGGYAKFYISDDASVKVTGLSQSITIYVQNGKELELNIKPTSDSALGDYTITVYSVTGDQKRITTSTVDGADKARTEGKIVLLNTVFTFNGVKGQTVTYEAMMPYTVDTHTTTTSGKKVVTTIVDTDNSAGTIQMYAIISSDTELNSPAIGSLVTIAPGQFIDVTGTAPSTFAAYGVKITDVTAATSATSSTSESTKYTYYAIGADAGTFDMDNASDAVDVVNGSIIVNNGNSIVKASDVKGVTVTNGGTDKLTVANLTSKGMTDGFLTVTGDITFTATLIIEEDAVVSVSNNTTLTGAVNVKGLLNLRNSASGIENLTINGTGIVSALNEKLWYYPETEPTKPKINPKSDSDFTGLYDVSAITKSADVKEAFSTAIIEKNQTFVVVADTVVTTSLDVQGVLIVNPGVTLTITKTNNIGAEVKTTGQYAQIINNGDILIKTTKGSGSGPTTYSGLNIQAGLFENNGRIVASSDAAANPAPTTETPSPIETVTINVKYATKPLGIGFINNGTITVSQNDNIAFDANKFINNGTMSVNGKISASTFKNLGDFTLTNAKVKGNITVNTDKGASVNVVAAELASGAFIKVSDTSYIQVTATNGPVTVRGITVNDTGNKTNGKLDLSGSMGITKVGTTSGYATLLINGGVTVNKTATIGEGYLLSVADAKFTVPGDLTIMKKGSAISSETSDIGTDTVQLKKVTGTVTDIENRLNLTTNYIAAKYSTSTATIYTSLEKAVPAAAEAGVSLISVGEIVGSKSTSYPVVTSDVSIPAGIFVSGTGITVGDDDNMPTILIESSAGFSFTKVKLVNGMIIAQNANDINTESVSADVKVIDSEEYTATFMSLNVAITLAEVAGGGVIELSQDFEGISSDLVIPAGVVVDATAAEDSDKYFTLIDSNLVVDGVLIVNDFWFIATTDDTKSITVNGMIMDYHSDGKCITDWWYTPVGVSYKLTVPDETGDEHTWYVITSLDNLQESIFMADDAKVNVEGDVKLGDLTIHGTEDMPAEVTFKGNVTADTITIDNTELKFLDGNRVTATVADALGSITITGAYVDKALSIYSEDDAGVYMAGAVTDDITGTYSIRFDGLTGINGNSKSTIGWGKYTENSKLVEAPSILFNGVTTATGKRVIISNTVDDTKVQGMATITGSVIVDHGTKLIMNCDTEVTGALVAVERTEEAVAGAIEANGKIFVGMLESDIYDYTAVFTAAEAIFSGKVALGANVLIYVSPDATVDPTIVEDLDTLDIYVDDEVWFSVYAYATKTFGLDYLAVPMFNSAISGIEDAKLNSINYKTDGNVILQIDPDKTLSQYGGAIYIGLNYHIFEVKIKTDGSVKAVYIDGILMETGENKNIFKMLKLAAGTHKVTVEAATGYDADKCVLYTELGTILPGMAFTFTEYDVTEYDGTTPVVVYNINGTEIQPEPVPPTPEEESQWTVTTILLVILVVLIAIMAVIVALRLNRS